MNWWIMHGIEGFFAGIADAITSIWRGRNLLFRPGLFDNPVEKRRSQVVSTIFCVLATLLLLGMAAAVVGFFWWLLTSHQRG